MHGFIRSVISISLSAALAGVLGAAAAAGQTCGERGAEAAHRFTDHGDGTLTDATTGLTWKRCSEGQRWEGGTCQGVPAMHTWRQAQALAQGSRFAGRDDWRLPELKELRSIVEGACRSPSIDGSAFPGTPGGWYWSSRVNPGCSGGTWGVSFAEGDISLDDAGNPHLVRLVRGEPL